MLHQAQGDYAAAMPLYQRALAIAEKALGPDHPDTAMRLNSLAGLYLSQGNYAAALPLYQRALAIAEKALGPDHPDTAMILGNLAYLHRAQGDYAAALPLDERALAIREQALGPNHPDTATSLHNLARLYEDQGDYAAALPIYQRALAIVRRQLELTAAVQSERQQLAMSQRNRGYLDSYLDTAGAVGSNEEASFAEVLAWKGTVTARQRHSRLARATNDPEIVKTLEQLQTTARRLATIAFAVPDSKRIAAWRDEVDALSRKKEELEIELSRLSADFRAEQEQARTTPDQLQTALPADAALVDLLVYTHLSPQKAGKRNTVYERRVAAFVVRHDQPVASLDLGPAAPIEAAIKQWHDQLDVAAADQPAGDELRRLLLSPLEQHLASVSTVFVSPDGALAQIPWGALPGREPGTYLIEERAVAVIPVPQQLPQLLASTRLDPDVAPSLLVVGNVDYGAAPGVPSPALLAQSRSAPRGNHGIWNALPGTIAEADEAQTLFRERFAGASVQSLTGARASENALREQAPRRRFLHLATHGFFAPPEVRSALTPDQPLDAPDDWEGQQRQIAGYHPGLLSGLVLAGANQPTAADQDDGILTALEVAELDLSGVELAVLSACETGLGPVAGGEGLLGLQRAFQTAGARNVVASLWKVDDQATAALMRLFYYKLWSEKKTPMEALREAQLALLHHPEQISDLAATRGPAFGQTVKLVEGGKATNAKSNATANVRQWAAFVLSGPGN